MSNFNPISDLKQALIDESRCKGHPELRCTQSVEDADIWWEAINKCASHNRLEHLRWFGAKDLYFLLVFILNCKFLKHKWYFDRCQEFQANPLGCVDLWSRNGGKSTIGTFGANIQAIINNPNVTICIFSHTKPIARGFLRQIKQELENNSMLKEVYPEIFWQDPRKESPKWSEEEGIVVKRTANPKESTLEAYGLTDGQPTGKHFAILDYDDAEDERSVTTSDQIDKLIKAWELSLNLRATDPIQFRVKGTLYATGDLYETMQERGFGKFRVRCIINKDGSSDLLSDETIALMKQSMSPSTWALQILLDPTQADKERGFKQEWLKYWKVEPSPKGLNKYIFVDPGGKHESSTSYTGIVVLGCAADKHIYVLRLIKDRLSLVQKLDLIFQLHREYDPKAVYYERYGMQSDVEAIRKKQEDDNYRFQLIEVGATSGVQIEKDKRIEKLQPTFAQGLILLPPLGSQLRKMFDNKEIDMVESFVKKEYNGFPYSREKDLLDALARIHDPVVNLIYPRAYGQTQNNQAWGQGQFDEHSWMSG